MLLLYFGTLLYSLLTLIVGYTTSCKVELDNLVERKRSEFLINSRKQSSISKSISGDQHPTQDWRPKGQLVAHLHEHQVYRLLKA